MANVNFEVNEFGLINSHPLGVVKVFFQAGSVEGTSAGLVIAFSVSLGYQEYRVMEGSDDWNCERYSWSFCCKTRARVLLAGKDILTSNLVL